MPLLSLPSWSAAYNEVSRFNRSHWKPFESDVTKKRRRLLQRRLFGNYCTTDGNHVRTREWMNLCWWRWLSRQERKERKEPHTHSHTQSNVSGGGIHSQNPPPLYGITSVPALCHGNFCSPSERPNLGDTTTRCVPAQVSNIKTMDAYEISSCSHSSHSWTEIRSCCSYNVICANDNTYSLCYVSWKSSWTYSWSTPVTGTAQDWIIFRPVGLLTRKLLCSKQTLCSDWTHVTTETAEWASLASLAGKTDVPISDLMITNLR